MIQSNDLKGAERVFNNAEMKGKLTTECWEMMYEFLSSRKDATLLLNKLRIRKELYDKRISSREVENLVGEIYLQDKQNTICNDISLERPETIPREHYAYIVHQLVDTKPERILSFFLELTEEEVSDDDFLKLFRYFMRKMMIDEATKVMEHVVVGFQLSPPVEEVLDLMKNLTKHDRYHRFVENMLSAIVPPRRITDYIFERINESYYDNKDDALELVDMLVRKKVRIPPSMSYLFFDLYMKNASIITFDTMMEKAELWRFEIEDCLIELFDMTVIRNECIHIAEEILRYMNGLSVDDVPSVARIDRTFYNCLIINYCCFEDLSSAIRIYNWMIEKSLKLSSKAMNSMIGLMTYHGRYSSVKFLLKEMQRMEIQIKKNTVAAIMLNAIAHPSSSLPSPFVIPPSFR